MRKYKVALLNENLNISQKKDLKETEDALNRLASQGWILQETVSPNDLLGSIVGIFYKEEN